MKSSEKMTILLVEDQAIIAMSEATMLKKNGYDVIVSSTGEQAIVTVEENPTINLILMDIDLGKGIDGTEAAQRILKFKEVPIVFLSNHTEKEIVERTEKITSYGYVVKNSGETVLIASIKMAFKLFEAHHQVIESEKKLIESDTRFHILERQIDDVIWTMDMNFRFTYVSPSIEKMHGYTVDEMMKLNLQDYLTFESTQIAINILAEEINNYITKKSSSGLITVVLHQIRKEGTVFPTEVNTRFLLDAHKNPIGIIGVTRDISERQKSREALLESKRALDLALEGAQIGFWDSDYVTGKVIRSEIWASMLGYTLEEVENTSDFWWKHIHPDDFEHVREEVRKHEANQISNFNVEHRIKTKSGKYKWILDWGKVFERDENGNPVRAMGLHIDIDNRVNTERKLLEINKTLNLALEGSHIGLWDQNFITGKVERTQYWAQMLGYSPDEIEGKLDVWKSLIHPEDYEAAMKAASEHEQGLTEYYRAQHRLKCKDGNYKWVLNWGKISERDENGKPIRAVGIHIDIDDQIKTEQALIESEQRLRHSLEATNDGIWELVLPNKDFFVSQSYYKLLGYNTGEVLASYDLIKSFIHPDDVEITEQKFVEAVKNKSPFSSEYRIKKKDGNYIWVLGRGKVTQVDNDQDVVRVSGSITDINNRKLVQDSLKKSQEMLRHILEQFPGVVFWKDKDSKYLGCNHAFATAAGLDSPEQIVGKTDFDLPWAKNEAEFYRADDKQVIESAKAKLDIEETQHQSGNEIKWFNTNKVPLVDSQGKIIGILGTSNDITERKKAEQALFETERKTTSIFKVAPIGIGVTANRVLIEVNEYICNLLGYAKEELIGKSAEILYPTKEEFEYVGKVKYQQIEEKGIGTVETKWVHKNGNIIDILLSSTPINLKNLSEGVTFTALDITNRKRNESLIKESEANLLSFIDNRNESIWSIDKDYKLIVVNSFFKEDYFRAFNVELEKGINLLEILTPELKEFWKPKYDKAFAGENFTFEFSYEFNNQFSLYEVSLTPIISEDKVIGATAITKNITERKKAEEELIQRKEELERFEKIVIGRELKMIELKEKIEELEQKLKEYHKNEK